MVIPVQENSCKRANTSTGTVVEDTGKTGLDLVTVTLQVPFPSPVLAFFEEDARKNGHDVESFLVTALLSRIMTLLEQQVNKTLDQQEIKKYHHLLKLMTACVQHYLSGLTSKEQSSEQQGDDSSKDIVMVTVHVPLPVLVFEHLPVLLATENRCWETGLVLTLLHAVGDDFHDDPLDPLNDRYSEFQVLIGHLVLEIRLKEIVKKRSGKSKSRKRNAIAGRLGCRGSQQEQLAGLLNEQVKNWKKDDCWVLRANRIFLFDTERVPLIVMADKRLLWQFKRVIDENSYSFLMCLTSLLEQAMTGVNMETVDDLFDDKPVEETIDTLIDKILRDPSFPDGKLPSPEAIIKDQQVTRELAALHGDAELDTVSWFVARYFRLLPSEMTKLGQIALNHVLLLDDFYSDETNRGRSSTVAGKTYGVLYRARKPQGHYPLD